MPGPLPQEARKENGEWVAKDRKERQYFSFSGK
jgi:hypothetical protein